MTTPRSRAESTPRSERLTISPVFQVSDQAAADRRSRRQQQLVPDVRSAAECVLPRLACAATFVATSHVLHNAPSSTNVIVDVDGLYYKQQEALFKLHICNKCKKKLQFIYTL